MPDMLVHAITAIHVCFNNAANTQQVKSASPLKWFGFIMLQTHNN
jgi:hypothetical protein